MSPSSNNYGTGEVRMIEDQHYTPSIYDIICGRGDLCFTHEGNKIFREVITNHFEAYCSSKSKAQKSVILGNIIGDIHAKNTAENNSVAGETKFVRFNKKLGWWCEIGETGIKQKIGQTIREMLWQRDPVKRTMKAARRATNYKARRQLALSGGDNNKKKDTADDRSRLNHRSCVSLLTLGTKSSILSSTFLLDKQQVPRLGDDVAPSSFSAMDGPCIMSGAILEKKNASTFSDNKSKSAPDLALSLRLADFALFAFPKLLEDDFMISPYSDVEEGGSPDGLLLSDDDSDFSNVFDYVDDDLD
jgi:hypothetical protein